MQVKVKRCVGQHTSLNSILHFQFSQELHLAKKFVALPTTKPANPAVLCIIIRSAVFIIVTVTLLPARR
jgi:hypothetical protein